MPIQYPRLNSGYILITNKFNKMSEHKKIVEINGVKMEVDLRNAKVVENFKVGDTVKVLTKEYSNSYTSHVGMIVGFDEFKTLPTIVVAYLKVDYSSTAIEFVYINNATEDVEIAHIQDWDIPYSKQQIISKMDAEITRQEEKLKELTSKKELFLSMFGVYFEKYIGGKE